MIEVEPFPKRLALLRHLEWYFYRLSAMSPAELLSRVGEQIKRAAFRKDNSGWSRFNIGDGSLIAPPRLRAALSNDWPSEILAQTSDAVKALTSGELVLLGRRWHDSPLNNIDPKLWFLDPCTNELWPGKETFCYDISYRYSSKYGDVKFVWELNRLQFLQPIAAFCLQTNDVALYKRTIGIVLAWMEANPPFRGINWPSGIELAMRLVTIAIIVASAPNSDAIDASTRRQIRACIAAHAFWLARYPSLYSSANNHRVAEGLGLLIAGIMVPDAKGAAEYRQVGQEILSEAPLLQFYADGTGVEQSPTYAAFTLEMIIFAMILDADDWISNEAKRQLISAGKYLKSLMDRAGNVPHIGDDDEGRVIAWPPNYEERYVASIVAALAGLFEKQDLAPPSRDLHLRDVIFRSATEEAHSPAGISTYEAGGYTVVREEVAGHGMILVFDHGPLGFLSIAAHGHADALALWLHLDDQPILVDAGTYCYHSGDHWRNYFRSTAAHNTLEVAGESQSLTAGAFNWRYKANARLIEGHSCTNWFFRASHDGYVRRFGVEHQRIIRRAVDGFEIEDILLGNPICASVATRFFVHPELLVRVDNQTVVVAGKSGDLVRITAGPEALLELHQGRSANHQNYYSSRFGAKEETTVIKIIHNNMAREPLRVLFQICSSTQLHCDR
jgi:hypothetical protein